MQTYLIWVYQRFKASAIGQYIPEPYYLLKNEQGEVIGLAIEWRDARELGTLPEGSERVLSPSEIDNLQEAILKLPKEGIIPVIDMFNESNVLIENNGGTQNLWIAECKINKHPQANQGFVPALKKEMSYLRKNYQRAL